MSTFSAFFVWVLASFGAPVHACHGQVSFGNPDSCDSRQAPPPQSTLQFVEHKGEVNSISNGL